jgi:AbrB family looped-hinge helix DNA binding protein
MSTARTRLSSKGQVIIPKQVRERHGWGAGVELEVEDRGDAVMLRAVQPFPRMTIDEVRGCLKYTGPRVTLEQMDKAVLAEARKRR